MLMAMTRKKGKREALLAAGIFSVFALAVHPSYITFLLQLCIRSHVSQLRLTSRFSEGTMDEYSITRAQACCIQPG